jgi:hypothetical protein
MRMGTSAQSDSQRVHRGEKDMALTPVCNTLYGAADPLHEALLENSSSGSLSVNYFLS